MEAMELRAALEAVLFVSNEPVGIDELAESFSEESRDAILEQLEEIRKWLDLHSGGFMLEQAAGGWRLATRPEHDAVLRRYFARKGENRLSLAALECLAIVAYMQPITAPEMSEIRGVNSTGVIRTLLERRMIRVAGRKNVVGSPFLYRTTREFLVHFGLNDIRDLPKLEEFGDLIGENINEDLVAAIHAAPEGDAAAAVEGSDPGEIPETEEPHASPDTRAGEASANESAPPVESDVTTTHEEIVLRDGDERSQSTNAIAHATNAENNAADAADAGVESPDRQKPE